VGAPGARKAGAVLVTHAHRYGASRFAASGRLDLGVIQIAHSHHESWLPSPSMRASADAPAWRRWGRTP